MDLKKELEDYIFNLIYDIIKIGLPTKDNKINSFKASAISYISNNISLLEQIIETI